MITVTFTIDEDITVEDVEEAITGAFDYAALKGHPTRIAVGGQVSASMLFNVKPEVEIKEVQV